MTELLKNKNNQKFAIQIAIGKESEITMIIVPNAENAVIDIRKLRDYCFNSEHDVGKNKARLFSSILGMNADDAEKLRDILFQIITTHEAQLGKRDNFGQRYVVDFVLTWQDRSAVVRSGWIIRPLQEYRSLHHKGFKSL